MNASDLNSPPEFQPLWFYADAANQPVGPLPMDALLHLAKAGVIQLETQVVENGGTEWKKFASIVPPPANAEARSAPIQAGTESSVVAAGSRVSRPAAPPTEYVADKSKPPRKSNDMSKGQIITAFVALAIFLIYKVSTYKPAEQSSEPSDMSAQARGSAASERAKKPDTISPIFQHEAAFWLKEFETLAKKLEALVLNSEEPMPKTVEGYSKLVTTEDVRKSAKYDLSRLTARTVEVEKANKAGNAYAKVVETVRVGLTEIINAVNEAEVFVSQSDNRVKSARQLKIHLLMVKNAIRDAKASYSEASLKAGFELTERSEYKHWLDRGCEHARKLIALWKQLDENHRSRSDAEGLLTCLQQGDSLRTEYLNWIQTVWEKRANITDPVQMDRLIAHVDLEDELATLFYNLSSEGSGAQYIWPRDKQTTPNFTNYEKARQANMEGLARHAREAQSEFDGLPSTRN